MLTCKDRGTPVGVCVCVCLKWLECNLCKPQCTHPHPHTPTHTHTHFHHSVLRSKRKEEEEEGVGGGGTGSLVGSGGHQCPLQIIQAPLVHPVGWMSKKQTGGCCPSERRAETADHIWQSAYKELNFADCPFGSEVSAPPPTPPPTPLPHVGDYLCSKASDSVTARINFLFLPHPLFFLFFFICFSSSSSSSSSPFPSLCPRDLSENQIQGVPRKAFRGAVEIKNL